MNFYITPVLWLIYTKAFKLELERIIYNLIFTAIICCIKDDLIVSTILCNKNNNTYNQYNNYHMERKTMSIMAKI